MSDDVNQKTNKQRQDHELPVDSEEKPGVQEPNKKTETLETSDETEQDNSADSNIKDQIEALEAENNQLKDSALRAQAETQNVRLRAEKDVEKARKYALEKFVNELLPVADNLERALDAADQENDSQKSIIEGVELTLKSLQDTLKQFGVEPINPQDEPFDPQLHQAMSMIPNADVEPNTILNVFQKGYKLNNRLVRPAMVVVASTPVDTQ